VCEVCGVENNEASPGEQRTPEHYPANAIQHPANTIQRTLFMEVLFLDDCARCVRWKDVRTLDRICWIVVLMLVA
jgi:hypothetical protein